MTQENSRRQSPSSKRPKTDRNRPILITSAKELAAEASTPSEPSEQMEPTNEVIETSDTTTGQSKDTGQIPIMPVVPRVARRASFFSSADKSEKSEEARSSKAAAARLARAERSRKGTEEKVNEKKQPVEQEKLESKPATARTNSARPARPANPFKLKYILGMLIYLIAAQFVGVFLTQYLKSKDLDPLLVSLNLFGGQVPISLSTVIYLVFLVVLLIVLARLDMIPRTFSSAGTPRGSTPSRGTPGERVIPPTVREGVPGEHDNLYTEYRQRQRRDKKK